jgi:hypothetical protein
MDLREIECDLYYINVAHDRDQWRSCKHGNEHSDSIKDGKYLD